MVDLIFLVCTLQSPSACVQKHLLLEYQGSLNQCAMRAQPVLAQWSGEHPGFRVAGWHCEWPDQEEEKG